MKFMLLQNYAPTDDVGADEQLGARGRHRAHRGPAQAQPGAQRAWRAGDAQGLATPDLAKFVVHDGIGSPIVTDGPFAEFKELLAGYRIVDVESMDRAIEIAAAASAAPETQWQADPRPDRGAGSDGRTERGRMKQLPATEDLLREAAPQVLAAVLRRSRPVSAGQVTV